MRPARIGIGGGEHGMIAASSAASGVAMYARCASQRLQEGFDIGRRADRLRARSGALRFIRPVATLPRRARRSCRSPSRPWRRRIRASAPCRSPGRDEEFADLGRIGRLGGGDVRHHRHQRGAQLGFGRASAIASAAGAISAQWKGAETGSSMARFTPSALRFSMARSTAPWRRRTTTWPHAIVVRGPDDFRLATVSGSGAAFSQIARA